MVKLPLRINFMCDEPWRDIIDHAVILKQEKNPDLYISRASYIGSAVLAEALKDIELSTNRRDDVQAKT